MEIDWICRSCGLYLSGDDQYCPLCYEGRIKTPKTLVSWKIQGTIISKKIRRRPKSMPSRLYFAK